MRSGKQAEGLNARVRRLEEENSALQRDLERTVFARGGSGHRNRGGDRAEFTAAGNNNSGHVSKNMPGRSEVDENNGAAHGPGELYVLEEEREEDLYSAGDRSPGRDKSPGRDDKSPEKGPGASPRPCPVDVAPIRALVHAEQQQAMEQRDRATFPGGEGIIPNGNCSPVNN
jgi:hypothetical protein